MFSMRRYRYLILTFFSFRIFAANYTPFTLQDKGGVTNSFTENKGQVSDVYARLRPDILYSGATKDMSFFLKKDGISYQLYRVDQWKAVPIKEKPIFKNRTPAPEKNVPDKMTIYRLDINWLNCNTSAGLRNEYPLEGYSNYYLASCPEGALKVRTYGKVTYENIYKGISLAWYHKNGRLKYDYLVEKGADYRQIQMAVTGAEKIIINEHGDLILETSLGNIVEQAPVVIQKEKELKARWLVKHNRISFEIENLNPAEPFVIDPGVRVWGTYYGGPMNEFGTDCTTDKNGNAYFAGCSEGHTPSIIATPGAFQTSPLGACGFLAKFNSNGQRQWATFYGGGSFPLLNARALSCSTDPNGNIYLSGFTNSTITVASSDGFQTNLGGKTDAFLAKFDPSGTRIWGTYNGGADYEMANACVTDASGNVYLGGSTTSTVNIASTNSHQTTFGGGYSDAFLVKFNPLGQRLWSSYYGGIDGEEGLGCTVEGSGNIYLTGFTSTNTSTIIATPGSHQSAFTGEQSAFLAKFNSTGQRQWGTYYGGDNGGLFGDYTSGDGCATDAAGNVYLVGSTNTQSGTNIATAASHQPNWGGGTGLLDGFVAKFDANGVRQWGTYYGGDMRDVVTSCATDDDGNVYVSGYTETNNGLLFATPGTQQNIFGGFGDVFVASFGADGIRHWSTYYGGPAADWGNSCTLDVSGNIYLCGYTNLDTGNSLASVGSHQSIFGGRMDVLFAKFDNCLVPSPTNPVQLNISSTSNSLCSGQSVTLSVLGAFNYTWIPGSITSTSLSFIASSNISYTVIGAAGQGCKSNTVINIPVTPTPTLNATPFFYLCSGSATLQASGAETFSWSPGSITGSLALVNPPVTTNYTIIGANGTCTSSAISTVSLGAAPPLVIEASGLSGCKGSCFTFSGTSNQFHTLIYSWGDNASSAPPLAQHCYTTPGNYQITAQAIYTSGCSVVSSNTLDIAIFPSPEAAISVMNTEPLIINQPVTFQNHSQGAQAFTWDFGDQSTTLISFSSQDVDHTYLNAGNVCAKLIAADTVYRCTNTTTKCIDILCPGEIDLPNVFTPNDDDANDVFKFTTRCMATLNCTIYNRWATFIYSWSGINGGWDGRTTSGLPCSDGVYFYVIQATDIIGKTYNFKGSVTLFH
jgi:gliding motility-associated-like protein